MFFVNLGEGANLVFNVHVNCGIICTFYVFIYLQIAVDTILLCATEDCTVNDGLRSPLNMSHPLMVSVIKNIQIQ